MDPSTKLPDFQWPSFCMNHKPRESSMLSRGLNILFWTGVFVSLMFVSLMIVPNALANHGGAPGGPNPWHSDVATANVTQKISVDNADLRGFNPDTIGSATDPFPDTSRPCCLQDSTQFGNGLGAGASGNEINFNCGNPGLQAPALSPDELGVFGTGTLDIQLGGGSFPGVSSTDCDLQVSGNVFQGPSLFQQSRNGLLSRPRSETTNCDDLGTTTTARCNEITFGFLQDVQSQGQVVEMDFLVRSLTDADGNLIGASQGTFTQRIVTNGEESACAGTFTFDETNGFILTSGPMHEC